MKRCSIVRKHLTVGIVLLFVGITIAPCISAEINPRFTEKSRNTLFSPQNCTVTCNYVTFQGVEQVERELTVQDAVYLSQLVNTSENDILASELNRYGLVPQTMKVEQVIELLNETSVQEEFLQAKGLSYSTPLSDTDWMKSSFCSISGYGPSCYYSTLKSLLFRFALVYALYLFVTLPGASIGLLLSRLSDNPYAGLFVMLLFYIPQMFAEELLSLGQVFNPLKISPGIIVAELFDLYGHTPPHLNVSGANGNWTIQNYPGIGMHMVGFFGIWLTVRVQAQYPSATIKGHCLNIKAKGLDEYFWNGWLDWPQLSLE